MEWLARGPQPQALSTWPLQFRGKGLEWFVVGNGVAHSVEIAKAHQEIAKAHQGEPLP